MCGSFVFMFFVEYCLVFEIFSGAFSLCVGVWGCDRGVLGFL